MNLFHSIWTVVSLAVFIGIVLWAWSGRRKESFNEAAQLPLENDALEDDELPHHAEESRDG